MQKMLEDDNIISSIEGISQKIIEAYNNGNKVLIFGNGGSAADSQHIAGELVNKFRLNRASLPAIALTTDTSVLTSIGNDFGFNHIFEKQVEGLANKGDIVIGISTSGNSKNITLAFKMAKMKGAYVIGLLGNDGGENIKYTDKAVVVPSKDTPRIQETQMLIAHIICDIVEKTLFGENKSYEQSSVS
jgi:D-sedoheptulose 7-phosphate isomerase